MTNSKRTEGLLGLLAWGLLIFGHLSSYLSTVFKTPILIAFLQTFSYAGLFLGITAGVMLIILLSKK